MHAKILKTACENKRCCYLHTIIYLQRSRVLKQIEADQPTSQTTKELKAGTYAKAQVDVPLFNHACFNRIAGLNNRHPKLQLGLRLG
jgi:hypothetical protein